MDRSTKNKNVMDQRKAMATFKDGLNDALFASRYNRWLIAREAENDRVRKIFEGMTIAEVRALWDAVGDDSFSGPYDCADIHRWLNLMGDGDYCAV